MPCNLLAFTRQKDSFQCEKAILFEIDKQTIGYTLFGKHPFIAFIKIPTRRLNILQGFIYHLGFYQKDVLKETISALLSFNIRTSNA